MKNTIISANGFSSMPTPVDCSGRFFTLQKDGRVLMLRGVNLSGNSKSPAYPLLPSHEKNGFFDGKSVSFVGRPFPLSEADLNFSRLRNWGFNFLRLNITWEAIEHEGPGIYDYQYIEYIIQILHKAKEYGFRAFIDPHQDVWSRFTGGSGAPMWTLEVAGFNPRNFPATHAAMLHNDHPNPAEYPKMIWPTNYFKLGAATMFTLFFAGHTFAPNTMVNSVNIQEFLQSHFINAICEVAKAVVKAGLNENVVLGYDTLNEPHFGWIGSEDIDELNPEQELRKGITPTPFQAMLLGEGRKVFDIEYWEMTATGPRKKSTIDIDPQGKRAWSDGRNCIWADHGVWNPKNNTILKPDYFLKHPKTGDQIDFLRDYWKPFVNRISAALRTIQPQAIIFVEPPVNMKPPQFDNEDCSGRVCFAPHWYDGMTLLNKTWNPWFNIDYIGFLRGKYPSIAFAVKFGETAIRNCFKSQLRMIREEGYSFIGIFFNNLGKYPMVMGEIGIPFDMDNKIAYETGDYSSQIQALDANLYALEQNLLNFTLWNYCPDNSHKWGDQWNGEDLSLWSADSGNVDPNDLNSGGRAVAAFTRPYPILTAGTPTYLSFDLATKTFSLTFTRRREDTISNITEIFLPNFHYPIMDNIDVWVSHGQYQLFPEHQRLVWDCQSSGIRKNSRNTEDAPLVDKQGLEFRIIVGIKSNDGTSIKEMYHYENDRICMNPQKCTII